MKRRILAIAVTLMMVVNMMPANLLNSFALSADTSNADNSAKNKAQIGNHYDVSQVNGNKVKKADGSYETINRADYNTEAEYDAATAEKDRDDWRVKVNKTIEATGIENLFNVTLSVQTKEDIQENIISPDAAVVLVIDVSTSMKQCLEHGKVMKMFDSTATNTCSECNTLDKSRIYATQQAAQQFINNFAASDSNRQIAIVTFCRDAKVIQNWTSADNLATTSGVCAPLKIDTKSYNIYDGSEEWFNQKNLTMQSGTNIEGGLLLGRNVMSQGSASGGAIEGIDNKFVILLSDGAANACVVSTDDSKTYGKTNVAVNVEKKYIYDQSNTAANRYVGYWGDVDYHFYHGGAVDVANEIKKSGMTLDTVYCGTDTDLLTVHDTNAKGVKQTGVDCDFCDAANAHWVNSSNPDVTVPVFLQSFSDTYATAKNIDGLYKAFQDIEEKIEIATQAWKGADPMGTNGQFSGIVSETQDGEYTATSTNLIWDLLEAKPVITGKGTADETYTYSITYKVKLNTLSSEFDADTFYETNKPTELKYYFQPEGGEAGNLESIWFNIPTVQGYEGGYFKLIKVDENGNPLEQKAEFTISHTCNTCDICDDAPCSNCEKGTGEACASAWSDKAISGEGTAEDGTPLGVGFVSFHNIPSGHSYVLEETAAPSGFVKSDDKYKLTVSYGEVTVNELNEDGTVGDEVTGQLTVVNEEAISVSGKKTWSDNKNADITVNLYGMYADNGTTYYLYKQNNAWITTTDKKSYATKTGQSWDWTGLMKTYNGHTVNWFVEESNVPEGYVPVIDGYNITNIKLTDNEYIGQKVWSGDEGSDRPDSSDMKIALYKLVDGKEVLVNDKPQWIETNGDTWVFKFTGLVPFDEAGNAIQYFAKEISVPSGYIHTSDMVKIDYPEKGDKTAAISYSNQKTTWSGSSNSFDFNAGAVGLVVGDKSNNSRVYTVWTSRELDDTEKALVLNHIKNSNKYSNIPTNIDSNDLEFVYGTNAKVYRPGSDSRYATITYNNTSGNIAFTNTGSTNQPRKVWDSWYSGSIVFDNDYTPGTTTITNTIKTEDVSVEKEWVDFENEAGVRPGSITVTLTGTTGTGASAETVFTETATLSDANNWEYTWTGLRDYKNGKDVVYTVQEETVDGYTSKTASNNGTVVITNTLKTRPHFVHGTVDVAKVDQNGNALEGAVFKLYDGETVVATYSGAGFKISTKDIAAGNLPAAGEEKTYKLVETSAPVGYKEAAKDCTVVVAASESKSYDSEAKEYVITTTYTMTIDGEDSAKITNTQKILPAKGKASVKVVKKDNNGAEIDGATFGLYTDAKCETDPVVTYTGGSFEISTADPALTSLLPDEDKESITLYLKEIAAPQGYNKSNEIYDVVITASVGAPVLDAEKDAFVITTAYAMTIEGAASLDVANEKNSKTVYKHDKAAVTKVDQDGKELDGAKFKLYEDKNDFIAIASYDSKFTIKTEDLADFLPEAGESVTLWLKETTTPKGYEVSEEWHKVVISAAVTQEETLEGDAFVTEVTYSITVNGDKDASITNTKKTGESTAHDSITFSKVDQSGAALAGAEFGLFIKGEENPVATYETAGAPVKISTDDAVIKNLLPTEDGGSVTMYLKETKVPAGYRGTNEEYVIVITTDVETRYSEADDKFMTYITYAMTIEGAESKDIVNTAITSISVNKQWDDNGSEARPESATVELYANGEATGKTAVLNADNNWGYTWNDLDKYDENGGLINYTVKESNVPDGYVVQISGGSAVNAPFVITNIAETQSTITKVWNDANDKLNLRPESLTVTLHSKVGTEITKVKEVTLNDANNWTYTEANLPKYKNGAVIEYSWTEDFRQLPDKYGQTGYDSVVTENGTSAVITNTYPVQTMNISGEKSWSGDDNDLSLRPESVTVQLKQSGTVIATVVATADKNWAYEFSNLAKYDAEGKDFVYTVEEVPVPGYTSEVNGNSITNKLNLEKANDVNGHITIEKTDGEYPLEGATFTLYDGRNVVGTYTGGTVTISTEDANIKELMPEAGQTKSLTLKETAAPAGYKASGTEYNVVLGTVVSYSLEKTSNTYVKTTKYSITIEGGQRVEVVNEKQTGTAKVDDSITVNKKDEASAALDGATFTLYADANLTKKIAKYEGGSFDISTADSELAEYLPTKDEDTVTLYLKETAAPAGYENSGHTYEVVIKTDITTAIDAEENKFITTTAYTMTVDGSDTAKVDVVNEKRTGSDTVHDSISVDKQDQDGEALRGATFGLFDNEAGTGEAIRTYNAQTFEISTSAIPGEYLPEIGKSVTLYLIETDAPDGYTADKTARKVVIKASAEETLTNGVFVTTTYYAIEIEGSDSAVVKNTINTGTAKVFNDVTVTKVDKDNTATVLAGAEFALYDNAGCRGDAIKTYTGGEFTIDISDKAFEGKLPKAGKSESFYLKETKAPAGYDAIDTVYEVVVTAEESTPTYDPEKNKFITTTTYTAKINGKSDVEIENTITPAEIVLGVEKSLTGRSWENSDEFEFTLTSETEFPAEATVTMPEDSVVTVNKDAKTAEFGAIKFHKAGTYTFSVAETGKLPANVAQAAAQEVTVKVTMTEKGLVAEVTSESGKTLEFQNVYTPVPADVKLKATKVVTPAHDGQEYTLKAGSFKFKLTPSENNGPEDPLKITDEFTGIVTNDADGNIGLPAVEYTKAGTYVYTLQEVECNSPGMICDTSVYTITVEVEDDPATGKLSAAVTVDGEDKEIVFNNVYDPEETTALIHGTKTLGGGHKDLEADEFVFQLLDSEGEVIQEVKNTVTGIFQFEFEELTYDKTGVYEYTVVEKNLKEDGYTYDTKEYPVKVTVKDVDGALQAEVEGVMDGDESIIGFANTYVPEAVKGNVSVSKELTGRDWTDNDKFTFRLTADGKYGNDVVMPGNLEIIKTEGNDSTYSGAFDDITFKKAGTYKFNITEVNGGADGITYDNAQYTVEFVVADAEGKLSIKSVTYYDAEGKEIKASDVKFTNEYSAEGRVTLGAVKTVTGKDLTDEVFTFELKDAKGTILQTKTNAADGTITFDPISYTEADLGEHKYTISEVAGDNDKFSYSKDVYTVTVTVTDNGDGTLTARADRDPSAVKFVNTYTPAAASATLEGHKTLTGRDLNKGEFSFTMTPVNGAPMPEGVTSETVTNDADGNFVFSPITYTQEHAGNTYEYVISEVKGNLGGVTYDNSTITAKVTVGYDSNKGVLSTSVAYEPGEVEFANTYSAKDGEIVLGASKVLDGRALKAGEFSFELKDANGKVLQTKTNAADGTVTFDKLTYTEPGTYVYRISEVNDGAKGIGYDKTVHTVKVTVEDNLKGQLVAKADKAAAAVQFNNTYTPDPVKVSMNGNKVLDGRTLKAGEFSFELSPVDGAPMPESKNPETVPNAADGTITFSSIVFDDDDAGKTYEYTIVEKSGDKAGVTYDKDTVSVFVTVTKDAETGDLSTSVKYQKANGKLSDGFTFKNSYKPEDSDGISVYANKTVVPQNGNSYEMTGGEFRFEIIPGENNPAGDPVVRGETTNDEDGSITAFEDAVYTAKGTYTYTLIELTGEKSGFSYDDHTFVITVKVTDDTENAKLVAAVDSIVKMSADGTEAPVNDIEFVNTYDPEKATANIHGHKTLNSAHKALEAGEFTFQLLDEEGNVIEEVTNDINGVFHFSDIEYSTAGTYTYTIVEKNEGKPGYTYSDAEHVITVKVTDDNNGHLTAEVSGIKDDNGNVIAEFVNGYEPEPVKINVGTEFSKTLDGRSMDEGEFTFVLMDGEDEIARATNDVDGKFVFKNITFEKAGTYTYTISEVEGDKSGVTYDDAVYTVEFKVKDEVSDGDKVTAYGGQLKVDSVTYYDADGTKIDAADVVFENEYKAEGGIQLTAKKVLNGRTLKDGEFRFVLTDEEGNEQVKTNDADGDIVFDAIKYDKAGTYTYVVKEVAGNLDNVTYSEEEYTVTVTVTDNRDGTLTAKADKDISDLVFTNTYTPDPVVVTDLGGIKTLEGRAIKAGEFSFTIEAAENVPLPEEATVACDKNGNFQFGKITYTKAGTYTYTISEDAGVVPGVTYDESEVTVVVTVTKDEITGVLSVTHEYQDAEGKALEKCTFKNKYEAKDTDPVSFTAVKAVEPTDGNSFTIKEGDFRFELTPAAGNPAADPLKDGVKTANKADGSVDFGNVQYEKAGTYVYTVREAAGDRGGITYDTSVYTITVKVTDDTAEAKLKAEVVITDAEGNVVEEMAFTNAYSPSETTALIYGHKYLDSEHKDLEAGEFSFEIKAVTENAPLPEETVVTNDAAGIFQFEFGEIKYTKPGTYEYEVVEVNQNETGYTYDDTVREVTVTVVDVNGELKATVEGVEDGSGNPLLTFNNEYVPEPEKVTIGTGFSKELNGRDLIAGEFTFQLRDGDTLIKEAVNDAEGNFVFEDLEFTKAGTYEYTVSEKESIAGGVESDTSVYNVKIVIEDKDGKLEATSVTYSDAEGNAIAETDVKFVNTYTASGDIQLGAAKLLKGKNLNAGDFMFELKDAEGNVIGTAVNEANGTVTFDPINYTEAGEYVYTISEVNNAAANVTYDTAVYTVTVTVTDNGDGTLTAETDIPLTDITFVNTYTEPKKSTQTGDGFNGGLYGALALMAALTGAGVVFGRRRRDSE